MQSCEDSRCAPRCGRRLASRMRWRKIVSVENPHAECPLIQHHTAVSEMFVTRDFCRFGPLFSLILFTTQCAALFQFTRENKYHPQNRRASAEEQVSGSASSFASDEFQSPCSREFERGHAALCHTTFLRHTTTLPHATTDPHNLFLALASQHCMTAHMLAHSLSSRLCGVMTRMNRPQL